MSLRRNKSKGAFMGSFAGSIVSTLTGLIRPTLRFGILPLIVYIGMNTEPKPRYGAQSVPGGDAAAAAWRASPWCGGWVLVAVLLVLLCDVVGGRGWASGAL